MGRKIRTTFADTSWTENTYDLLNQVLRTTDNLGASVTNVFLMNGLVTIRQNALGTLERTFFDAEDRATNSINRDGLVTVTTYDDLGRTITSTVADYTPTVKGSVLGIDILAAITMLPAWRAS